MAMGTQSCVFLALLCLVAHGSECPTPEGNVCDLNVYKCCDLRFREHIGISPSTCPGETIDEPQCIQQALNLGLYGYGREGVNKVCDAYNEFRSCLGSSLRSCTTAYYHLKNGHPIWRSKGLQALYSGMNFICGPGLETLLVNDRCVTEAYREHVSDLHHCTQTFENNVRKDHPHACTYERELTGCYELVYRRACNAEVAWWSCEHQRSYASGFLPQCDAPCTSHQGRGGRLTAALNTTAF
ncbi:unnamed protein product [Bursaphelenchus xylophilus]|nr:unnamed protein product [Bursaphelenchus xylophilus]CAG9118229.1 unnamed protein product [Bursaphelenchus xylophilus]